MRVLLLTQDGCAACTQTTALVERLAAEYPLTLTTLDLQEPEAQALARRAGIAFPPGILIDGEAVGFGRVSERQLRREIVHRLEATAEFCPHPPAGPARRWLAARWRRILARSR